MSEKWWATACYIPAVNLVICTLCSVRMVNSQLCLFHFRQGLVLFSFWFATILVAFLSQTLSLMLWGVVLLLHIWGGVVAFQQKTNPLPLIGNLAMKIPPYYLYKLLTGKDPEKISTNNII